MTNFIHKSARRLSNELLCGFWFFIEILCNVQQITRQGDGRLLQIERAINHIHKTLQFWSIATKNAKKVTVPKLA